MKKLVLGLFVIAAMSANAQIESGKLFVGGSVGFGNTGGSSDNISGGTTSTTENTKTMSFNLIPRIGFMVTENIGAGLGIGYSFYKTTTPNGLGSGTQVFDQIEKDGAFIISPFVRYYKSVSDKFYLFGQFSLPIRMGSHHELKLNDKADGVEDNDNIDKYSSFGFGLALGADYFISDNIALEAGFNLFNISYNSSTRTYTDKDGKNGAVNHSSSFNFDFDTSNVFNTSSISVGIKIFI